MLLVSNHKHLKNVSDKRKQRLDRVSLGVAKADAGE